MMIGLCYFICNVLSDIESFILEKNVLDIVSDRKIYDCVFLDCLNLDNIEIINACEYDRKSEKFLYDRYFPKLFFYSFTFDKLRNPTENVSIKIRCLSIHKETLFEFKIEYDLTNILLSEFYSADKKKLHVSKFCNDAYEDIYIFTMHKKNVETIENSLIYLEKLESIKNIFLEIPRKEGFCIHKIFDAELDKVFVSDHFSPSFLNKARKIKQAKFEIANLCFKKFFSLFVPKLKENQKFEQHKYFAKMLSGIIKKSLLLVKDAKFEIQNRILIDKDLKASLLKKLDQIKKDLVLGSKTLTFKKIKRLYYNMKNNLRVADEIVKKAVSKGNVNIEATLDCDIRKIDNFYDLYNSILMDYCDILSNNHVIYIFSHYFLELKNVDFNNKNPFEIHRDIIIAKELRNYLMNYEIDKTDFLIFSQTDYFRYELAFRIVKNSKDLLGALVYKKRNEIKSKKSGVYFSKKDLKYMTKLIHFEKKWQSMFISVRDLETISFNAIIDDLSAQNNECKKDNQELNKRKNLPANQNGNESGVLDMNNLNYVTVNVQNEQHNPMMPDKLILNHAQINNLDFLEEGIEFVGGEQPNKVYNDIKANQFLSKDYEFRDNEVNDNMKAQEKNKSIKNVVRCNEITVSAIKNETFENEEGGLPIIDKMPEIEKDDFETYNYNFESKDQEVNKEKKNYYFYLSTGSLIVCSMLMVLLYVKLKNAN